MTKKQSFSQVFRGGIKGWINWGKGVFIGEGSWRQNGNPVHVVPRGKHLCTITTSQKYFSGLRLFLGINRGSKKGQRALVCTIYTSTHVLFIKSQKCLEYNLHADGMKFRQVLRVVPEWALSQRKVDLGFCLQKHPKGLGPLKRILGFQCWACFPKIFGPNDFYFFINRW